MSSSSTWDIEIAKSAVITLMAHLNHFEHFLKTYYLNLIPRNSYFVGLGLILGTCIFEKFLQLILKCSQLIL